MSDVQFIKVTHIPYEQGVLCEDFAREAIVRVQDINLVTRYKVFDNRKVEFIEVTNIYLDERLGFSDRFLVMESVSEIYDRIQEAIGDNDKK